MADSRVKAILHPRFQLGICTHLKDDIVLEQESIIYESPTVTILHNMIGEDPKAKFPII